MIRGTDQPMTFQSTPPGAKVELSNGLTCSTTPCTLTLARKDGVVVTFSKEGCRPAMVTVTPRVGAAFMYAGIVDYDSGAAFDLEPNPVAVVLDCGAG